MRIALSHAPCFHAGIYLDTVLILDCDGIRWITPESIRIGDRLAMTSTHLASMVLKPQADFANSRATYDALGPGIPG